MALKWLIATATQGSADAFVEAEFNTGVGEGTRTALRIRRIEWFLPNLPGADSNIIAVLRRNSASATVLNSPAVIAAIQRTCELTTSGMNTVENFPNSQRYERDEDLLIVEQSLFLDLDSNGTSASNACVVRIGYETRSVTENERLSILASSAA